MKANVGKIDKNLRIVAGIAIIAVGFYYQSWWGAIGLAPLITGLIKWCPAYLPFGISTCSKE
jgi:sulfite exporter TauE/SafE